MSQIRLVNDSTFLLVVQVAGYTDILSLKYQFNLGEGHEPLI